MSRIRSPALERAALALVEDLIDHVDDFPALDARLDSVAPGLAARVRRLLGAARTTEAMDTLAGPAAPDLPAPDRIGPFALVEEIGRGGMGNVWRGTRTDGLFEQEVAIKLLRASPTLFGAHFDAERRILARLDHPGIARLIDGGLTDAGLPYLIMDHAPGRHIDRAAASLPLASRVALFCEAAAAVRYAHGKRVVHADLKPSNIIVGDDGRVRLLDFGVARLIGEDATGTHPLTPAFASPSRRAGAPPEIADDVFALGRILSGLIGDDRDADLRAIAARAAHKQEARRYPGVGDLIADLARWRDRLPVSARPATLGYRGRLFARRHRLGLAATFVAILALSITSIAAVRAARAANQARAAAEQRFADVRALSRFMLTDLYDELGNAPGTVAARARIAARAGGYLDRLAAAPDAPRTLRLEIAQGYERLARVLGVSGTASLGRPEAAEAALARADAIVAALLAEREADPAAQALAGDIALDRWTLAGEDAEPARLNALARRRFARALALDPARADAAIGLIDTERNRAFELIWGADRPAAAIPVLDAALARLARLAPPPELADRAAATRFSLLNRLGDARYYAGDVPGSLVAYREAEAMAVAALAARPTLAWLERRGESYWYVSGSLEDVDRAGALAAASAGVATLRRVLGHGPDANAEKWLAILYGQEAALLAASGRHAAAARSALASAAIRERRVAASPRDHRRTRDLAIGLVTAADILAGAGQRGAACRHAGRAVAAWQTIERRGQLGARDRAKAYPKARAAVARLCTVPERIAAPGGAKLRRAT